MPARALTTYPATNWPPVAPGASFPVPQGGRCQEGCHAARRTPVTVPEGKPEGPPMILKDTECKTKLEAFAIITYYEKSKKHDEKSQSHAKEGEPVVGEGRGVGQGQGEALPPPQPPLTRPPPPSLIPRWPRVVKWMMTEMHGHADLRHSNWASLQAEPLCKCIKERKPWNQKGEIGGGAGRGREKLNETKVERR